MPIITFVAGYVYLVFGSFKLFKSIGYELAPSCFLTTILTILMVWHIDKIAKSTSGNLVCPRTFALQMILTHFSMTVVITGILALGWVTPNIVTKTVLLILFALFGYLLNIGAGTFPTFSIADPFYWNQNRVISPAYDRAFKTVLLSCLSYCFANLTSFWHSIATICFILLDIVLMAHYWEIAEIDDWEEQRRGEPMGENNIREDPMVDDLHMD